MTKFTFPFLAPNNLASLISRSISAFEAISFVVFLACDYAEASFVVASNDIIVE